MAGSTMWRSRPVFITSTFRDMHAERDWLRTRVFPALEERLRERYHHLDIVDLRWGVDSTTARQEAERERMVLTVCLGEIERSRPFLVGLLGDRYGWIPPPGRVAGAAIEAGFDGAVEGHSITELEILHGVLGRQDQRVRSWFYLRQPLPYDAMLPEDAARYSDAHSGEGDAADKVQKLARLKAGLRDALGERVRAYLATWDASARSVTGLEAWGAQVERDLWTDLEAETAGFLREAPASWQAQDRLALDEFVESRTRGFVGRRTIAADLKALATSPAAEGAPWGACVTGEPGGGKSSLFGHLLRELRRTDAFVLVHAAGISVQSSRVSRMLRRWTGELAVMLCEPDPLGDGARDDEVDQAFAALLPRAAARRRVVVLIDALNQFEGTPRGMHLTWLPKAWPDNARLIATTVAGPGARAVLQRPSTHEVVLPAIGASEAAKIVKRICARHHRTLNPGVQRALLAKLRRDGAPAFGNPLWLEMAAEELNMLGVEAFEEADTRFGHVADGGDRIIHFLRHLVEGMPGDAGELYNWMLDGADRRFGARWTRAFTNAVAVSRAGWREADLRVLMPRLSGEPWDDLRFATLRRAFRAHVVQRGAQAQWDFAHAQARTAVEARLAASGTDAAAIHRAIADYLWDLPADDPLRQTEIMAHLVGAGDQARAARHLADDLSQLAEDAARQTLATAIVEARAGDRDGRIAWVCGLLEHADEASLAGGTGIGVRRLVARLVQIADYGLFAAGLRDAYVAFMEQHNAGLTRLNDANPGDEVLRNLLGKSHFALAQVLEQAGQTRRAAQVYGAALAILEDPPPTRDDLLRLGSVCGVYSGLARVFAKHGLTAQAELASEKAARLLAMLANGGTREDGPPDGASGSEVSGGGPPAEGSRLIGSDDEKYRATLMAAGVMGDNASRQRSSGNHGAAIDGYRAACSVYDAFLASASGPAGKLKTDAMLRVADARQQIGAIFVQTSQWAEACGEYVEAGRVLEILADRDPGAPNIVHALLFNHEKRADVLREQDRRAEAGAALLESLALRRRLVAQDPANPKWQSDLALGLARLAALRREMGDPDRAARDEAECGGILERMRDAGVELEPRLERMRVRYGRHG